MKLSFKTILPIILISALLISLSGCIPTTPSPGATTTTGGTITGIFETPEACCIANRDHTEGWVPLVNATVSVIDSKGVTHTTKTDSDGKYWLTDVAPGIYYVVTACCECEDREGVYKDVAEEELKEGDTYDAGIADCESTALGLMVDYLLSGDVFTEEDCNCYCNCFDEESQIYASLVTTGVKLRVAGINLLNPATKPLEKIKVNADFQGFVVELCDLLEACCVEPGVAPIPPPPPPPDPCLGHTPPYNISLAPLMAIAGQPYSGTVSAIDDDGDTLAFSWTTGFIPPSGMTLDPVTGEITWTPGCEDDCICGVELQVAEMNICDLIKVTVSDACDSADAEFCIQVAPNSPPSFTTTPPSESVKWGALYSYDADATDFEGHTLTYAKGSNWPTWLTLNTSIGLISGTAPCCQGGCSEDFYVEVSDECSTVTQNIIITVTVPVVGDSYGGGIVAYILQSEDTGYIPGETHGLIAATADQSTTGMYWSNITDTEIGATAQGTAIGTGQANTTAIVGQSGCTSGAAYYCDNLVEGSFSDWYLPSKDELYNLYLNRVIIGGFEPEPYWSSSEDSATTAWARWFFNGDEGGGLKSGNDRYRLVRAVRAF